VEFLEFGSFDVGFATVDDANADVDSPGEHFLDFLA
jgi:hypothetical protein